MNIFDKRGFSYLKYYEFLLGLNGPFLRSNIGELLCILMCAVKRVEGESYERRDWALRPKWFATNSKYFHVIPIHTHWRTEKACHQCICQDIMILASNTGTAYLNISSFQYMSHMEFGDVARICLAGEDLKGSILWRNICMEEFLLWKCGDDYRRILGVEIMKRCNYCRFIRTTVTGVTQSGVRRTFLPGEHPDSWVTGPR